MRNYHKNIPSEAITDFEDFYERMANELPDGAVIAEIGVACGRSAIMLAEKLSDLGKDFTLYMVDNFGYGGYKQRNEVLSHIVNSGLGNKIKLLEMSSLDASCEFPDSHFDFCFIDSSHKLQETKAAIRLWYYKMKEDCVLAGHDYYSKENPEVQTAVLEVIPTRYLREPISDQQSFEPEQLLHTEQTRNGNGVWFLKKKFYIKLN